VELREEGNNGKFSLVSEARISSEIDITASAALQRGLGQIALTNLIEILSLPMNRSGGAGVISRIGPDQFTRSWMLRRRQ
jgi:hypothetical protein